MASDILSIIAVLVKYLFKVDPVQRQFSYMWNNDSNFEKLKTEVEMLKAAKDRVQHKADHAKSNNEEIDQIVDEWLNRAITVTDEVEELIRNEDKAKNNCFMGLCLDNFMTCCGFSREASRNVEIIGELLKEEGEFDNLPLVFESRRSTLEDILNALRDPNVNRIGVYGLPGVGKTTLAEEVGRLSKKDNLFDVVVFEKVTNTSDAEKIQEAIADKLGMESSKEDEGKKRLYTRLKNDKKILIILDNFWDDLDLNLEAIGIPSTANRGGCKVLLTTRDRSVLERMDSKPFNIGVLNGLEAWNLFVKKMGDHNIEDSDLKSVATDVVNECRGLPIAIITIASALRHKGKVVWKNVLRELRRASPSNFEGVLSRAYLAIELSYNNLRGEEHKKLFLLCSLLPSHASTLDLLKYGRGLGILQGVFTMEEARVKVNTLVRELKDSCLLLDSHNNEWFSMHDFIREVAISIACRDEHVFAVRNEIEWEWPHKDTLEPCTKIWIYGSKNRGFIEGLECPKLELVLTGIKDNESVTIPENFFKGIRNLKVLDFTNMQLTSLPSSILLLKDLQTLCLDRCILGDISLIGNLTKLKILSFRGSTFIQLPKEIGQLTELRLLDLTNCSKLKVIPQNVISRLSLLEEFYMGNTFIQWEIGRLNTEGSSSASLDELRYLSNLTTLEIHIKNDSILPKGLFSKRLERYQICIGGEWRWFSKSKSSRTLKLKLHSRIFLDELQGVRNVEDLYLDEVQGVKNVLYELDDKGFPQLKNLHIQNNPHFLCIVDSMDMVPGDAFPLLKSLYLSNLINLEKIWRGKFTTKSFCKLKMIEVSMCHKLKNIFPLFVAKGLPQLRTIEVNDCSNMEEVLCIGGEDVNSNGVIERIELISRLRFLKLKLLPRLTSFCSKVKTQCTSEKTSTNEIISETELDTPPSLFNERVVFPNLEYLDLSTMKFEKIWHNQPPEILSSCLQNLTQLIVYGCGNLKHIFSSSIVRNFVQLQQLEIVNCMVLEEIFEGEGEAGAVAFVFPRVTSLKLGLLPQLKTFYPGKHSSEWPLLKKLDVSDCDKVKIFTSVSSVEENNEISLKQPLFLVEKVNPDLEELTLSGKDAQIMCQLQVTEQLFYRLKVLKIVKDGSADFSFLILERFNSVEKLLLDRGSYEELFSYEEGKKHVGMLKQIKFLEISNLPNLKRIWKQDSNIVDSTFQHLETLLVRKCNNLVNLVPSSASLKSLTDLRISYCNGLVNLVTSTTAKSLVQLRYLRIQGCKMITEIVASEGDVEGSEIVFNKLQFLDLRELQSLESFCYSENYNFNFPCLKSLSVEKCQNLRTFSKGVLNTPMLEEVYCRRWNDSEACWDGDLNTTIQRLHNETKNKGETSNSF